MILNARRSSVPLQSKVVATYTKFSSLSSAPIEDPAFYADLLALAVDREFLRAQLDNLPTEALLGPLKPSFNTLFRVCLQYASNSETNLEKKKNALDTLSILSRCIFAKTPTGWEVMEIMAGGVTQSDAIFTNLTAIINDSLSNPDLPVDVRHQVLQLALSFMCGVAQLSPGAYFLRRDLFPTIVSFIKDPTTEIFTFEAILLLTVLANFHKSKQNPYIKRIQETEDKDLMRKICWASNFALDAAVKAYQEISDDDTSQTLTSALGSMMSRLRPDRALTPVDPPRELFKSQPIEACVVVLPIFEFLRTNPTFPLLLISPSDEGTKSSAISSPTHTILSLSSYLLTHASSTSSPRAIVYANLCLNTLLTLVQNDGVLIAFSQPSDERIRLCRQRLPLLPVPPSRRAPLCALLDCCVLWLRHNLHKRLEVQSYTTCIWVCYRVIWFVHKAHIRLEYSWQELWSALLGLLGFLSSKIDSLTTTGGVEQLARATILLLDLCLAKCEMFLPTPQAVHQFVYELVRSSPILEAQLSLLRALAYPQEERRFSWTTEQPSELLLARLLNTTMFYQTKVTEAHAQSAKSALRVVAAEIDRDGLHGMKEARDTEPPGETPDVVFSRFLCTDVLSLMP
ncbi:hypothetical protein C8F04DRAFT_1083551 [Mycena alexandri]|uniref:Armadillo-like helical domain-containing protein n=1 Tax=Mycena alexandri TaxID=1745969 RepID=A0AAD6XCP6_9AGAR|nr:hypothetical protein C8F04DRAFT_1083551 [Mycena alexandri]